MLQVDLDSDEPLFAQVVRGLRAAIARREVRVGDRMPSVRQLAGDLGIHLNTVARAYRRLEEDGLLRVRHGQGVVVVSDRDAAGSGTAGRAASREALEASLREAFAEARLGGLGDAEIAAAARRLLVRASRALGPQPSGSSRHAKIPRRGIAGAGKEESGR